MGGSGKGLLSLLNGLLSNLSKAGTGRFNLGSRHEAVEAVRAQGYGMSL